MPDDPHDESMITPAMNAAIGKDGRSFTVEISRELVTRMAEALEANDPQLEAALAGDDAAAVVPHWAIFTTYARLRPQSLPGLPEHRLMAADEMRMLAPLRLGDVLTVTPRIVDIQERIGGRVGHSLFVHHEWRYTNRDGVEVARTRRTITHYNRRSDGGES